MNRRQVLALLSVGMFSVMAGCDGDYTGDGTPEPRWGLTISAEVQQQNSDWQTNVRLRNEYDWSTAFHNVSIKVYGQSGQLVLSKNIGKVTGPAEVNITTETFPYLITATADETPCDSRVNIGITYWNGSEDERLETVSDTQTVWAFDSRRCDEKLPPDRLLPETSTTTTPSSALPDP